LIIIATLWYSRVLLTKISADERLKVRNWAAAMQRQGEMVDYVRSFFSNLEIEERKYATIWCYAYERLLSSSTDPTEFDYYIKIISENKNIPFVLVDKQFRIIDSRDPEINPRKDKYLRGDLRDSYIRNEPIEVGAEGSTYYFYYKPSKLFGELKQLLDGLSNSFILEVVDNTVSIPVIITDSSRTRILHYGNIDDKQFYSQEDIKHLISRMEHANKPIEIYGLDRTKNYIYYESSSLLTNLNYLPFALFLSLIILITAIVLVYGLSRRAEQNQVWLGMSKETAHQLGTPLSSLLAWVEYYKLKRETPVSLSDLDEIEKDVIRLQTIAQRFSKIGSVPELKSENVVQVVYHSVSYIQARTSKRIQYHINVSSNQVILLNLNAYLFEWVIENICKNAVNAIGDNAGNVFICLSETDKNVIIDIQDTGKGLAKSMFKKIFEPGFTTKQRGWGLGLALCKRIVCEYHKGKIFVKNSVIGQGTTFRIILNK
ncbi:MAG: HAMP domain-containing sensor histidine kinase, partial [Bacteroidales bacterium]